MALGVRSPLPPLGGVRIRVQYDQQEYGNGQTAQRAFRDGDGERKYRYERRREGKIRDKTSTRDERTNTGAGTEQNEHEAEERHAKDAPSSSSCTCFIWVPEVATVLRGFPELPTPPPPNKFWTMDGPWITRSLDVLEREELAEDKEESPSVLALEMKGEELAEVFETPLMLTLLRAGLPPIRSSGPDLRLDLPLLPDDGRF